MPWIKKNLYLVIGGVVALGLLGYAVYFLRQKMAEDLDITQQLEVQKETLRQLTSRNPFPNQANIAAAKQTEQRLQEFLREVQSHFDPTPIPANLGDREFRLLLDNTVSDLQNRARQSGVKLPEDFYFTFDSQKNTVAFEDIEDLAAHLLNVRTMAEIVFDAKANSLVNIKRAKTGAEERAAVDNKPFLDTKPTTNQFIVQLPYELAFECFSPELEIVIRRLLDAPQAFRIKNMTVQPAPDDGPVNFNYRPKNMPAPRQMAPMPPRYGGGFGGGNPYAQRYGAPPMAMNPYARQQPAPPPAASGTTPKGNLLDEQLLRYTLTLEVIHNKRPEKPEKDAPIGTPPGMVPAPTVGSTETPGTDGTTN